ncbi:MAG: hypothetical protein EA376_02775 [Phycisphaeraceae bacterium]|nr:MAG: hypothetical protein EA376_02775 [Phycisphaeraceae bacterium]
MSKGHISGIRLHGAVAAALLALLGCLLAPVTTRAISDDGDTSEAGESDEAESSLQEVVIVLRGGQRIRGLLISEDANQVVIRVASVNASISREEIEQIIPQRPAIERYREMRAVIDDNDVDRLLLLIEWLRGQELLKEALEEAQHVLSVEPRNGEALRLMALIERQLELRDSMRRPEDREPRERVERPRRLGVDEFPLLTPDQVNLLKVYEVDLNDPPRILIERETVSELLQQYRDHPSIPTSPEGRAAFHRQSGEEILRTMFELQARDLYPKVKVQGLPRSLLKFRNQVNSTWLVNTCATTRCHGGAEAGRLMLYNRNPNSEASIATNFLILERFKLADGEPLINYVEPSRSPLLHMGLQRDRAIREHPDVHGWRPAFRTPSDRRFRQAVEWIQSMHRPRPEHPIEYEPPSTEKDGTSDRDGAQDNR